MITVSVVYRCLAAIILSCFYLTQWLHRLLMQLIYRHRYTIHVNINLKRHQGLISIENSSAEKLKFNKPTDAVALIINERIPESDLCQLIINSILFFRQFYIKHLIIYDYQGTRK